MHERFRDALLDRWGRVIARRPGWTVAACLVLAVLGYGLAALTLEFRSDRSDLVASDLPWNARYAAYKRNFPRWDDMLVCLEGAADDAVVDELARLVGKRLQDTPQVRTADAGFDPREAPRLFQAAPGDDFREALDGLTTLKAITAAGHVNAALAVALRERRTTDADQPAAVETIEELLDPFLKAMAGEQADFEMPGESRATWQPMTTGSGRIRLIFVQFDAALAPADVVERVTWLRGQVRDALASTPDGRRVSWGVTGIPVIEADETRQSIRDSTLTSILAFALILIYMFITLRGIVIPLLAATALALGLGWSFGWVVASVGHLQILSVFFCVMLLGLGVDFALHVVARLELIRNDAQSLAELVPRVMRSIGPGLITGAFTTAASFVVIALTDFTGAAEMGLIAAGGIVLCLIAVLSAFPALLALTGSRWKRYIHPREGGEEADFLHTHLHFVHRRPGVTVCAGVVVLAALGLEASRLRYDPNVLNLHPPGIESVEWENRLIADDARSAWAGLVVTTPDRAPDLVARLRGSAEVSDVGGMGQFILTNGEERTRLLNELRERAFPPLPVGAGPDALAALLGQVSRGLAEASNSARQQGHRDEARGLELTARRIDAVREQAGALDRASRENAWHALNDSFLAWRERQGAFLDAALRTDPLEANDLPTGLRERYVGTDGRWLLLVQPAVVDQSILSPERLALFVGAVREIAPEVLGPPVQIYESSRLIQNAYMQAALYALPVILLILVLDFRSLTDAVCALVPVLVGFVGAFGMMVVAGFPLNFANMIVMPMILGIGVDAGVHVVHRWRAEPGGRPAGLSGGTGRGITMTMLTTMIGFAALMIARHRGIQSLGFVMVAGLATTLLASYTILPALLHLRGGPRMSADQPAPPQS